MNYLTEIPNLDKAAKFFENKKLKSEQVYEFSHFKDAEMIEKIPLLKELNIDSVESEGFYLITSHTLDEITSILPTLIQLKKSYNECVVCNDYKMYTDLSKDSDFNTLIDLSKKYSNMNKLSESIEFENLSEPIKEFVYWQLLPF
jgi:hypothetical protein